MKLPTPTLSRAQDGNEAESGAETSLLPSAQAIKTKKTDPLDSVANLRSQRTKPPKKHKAELSRTA